MAEIYFDNSATTVLCNEAKSRMLEVIENIYGNPSSMHSKGVDAEKAVTKARSEILSALGVKNISTLGDNRLIFTASGTEADNLALFGTCFAKKFVPGKKVIISDSEHAAVLETAKKLEEYGFTVVKIPTYGGAFDYDRFEKEVDKNTVIVSVMLVNNETGAVNDIKKISRIVKAKNPDTVVHTDAVQGFMKMPLNVTNLGADLVTLSSHKIHGPKGVGALYVDPLIYKKRQLVPIIYGGGQEKGFRSGTENTIGMAGFGGAVSEGVKTLPADVGHMTELRDYICGKITGSGRDLGIKLNIPQCQRAAHIVSITLPQIKSETMLHFLSSKNIFVSSGSACSSNAGHISKTLVNFGLTESEADSTIRVSLGASNTFEEADYFISALLEGAEKLVTKK